MHNHPIAADMADIPRRRAAALAACAGPRRVVGDAPGARRLSRTAFRALVARHSAPSFGALARTHACYRGTSSARGVHPGRGPGYGAEFVFVGAGDTMRVIVVDPRAATTATLPLADFLVRGVAYWQAYPQGWATSRSMLPMPPDCQRSLYMLIDDRSAEAHQRCNNSLERYLGMSTLGADAPASPEALIELCAGVAGVRWRVDVSLARCSAPLFAVLETRHCRRLVGWQQGRQPEGCIENGRVSAPFGATMLAIRREIAHAFVAWATSTSAATLAQIDSAYAAESARRAISRKRRRISAGVPPACVGKCLVPTAAGGYAKDGVRWRVGAVISAMCLDLGMRPSDLVDVAETTIAWAAHGSASGLQHLLAAADSAKQYTVSCQDMTRAGGCPHRGDVLACATHLDVAMPTVASPVGMWQAPRHGN